MVNMEMENYLKGRYRMGISWFCLLVFLATL